MFKRQAFIARHLDLPTAIQASHHSEPRFGSRAGSANITLVPLTGLARDVEYSYRDAHVQFESRERPDVYEYRIRAFVQIQGRNEDSTDVHVGLLVAIRRDSACAEFSSIDPYISPVESSCV